VTIDALGIFDDDSDGLGSAHEVGIWGPGGILLASTAVGPGSTHFDPSASGVGRYVYESIGALTLGPLHDRRVLRGRNRGSRRVAGGRHLQRRFRPTTASESAPTASSDAVPGSGT
jgi:hypothetical protein